MSDKEIKLPTKLAKLGLRQDEIGALFVLLSLPDMNEEEKLLWEEDADFQLSVDKLMQRGIVSADGENLAIDLTFLEEDFWTIETYEDDDFKNHIYKKYINKKDIFGYDMFYAFVPKAIKNQLFYYYVGYLDLFPNWEVDSLRVFSSLDDARAWTEQQLEHQDQ